MKLFIIALVLPTVFCQKCPDPVKCADEDIPCSKGMDDDGCPYPGYCVPMKGPTGCMGLCAENCRYQDEIFCDNGMDDNGCWMGNQCIPMKDPMGCKGFCPAVCNSEELPCSKGMDENGCSYGPDYCIPIKDQKGCMGVCAENCGYPDEMSCDYGFDDNNQNAQRSQSCGCRK